MDRIRVVVGAGTGPTETAAYDAALLDAGAGNYNLVTVSSVVPPSAAVETTETLPVLGTTGDRLTVVRARAVGARAGAALSWARTEDGAGLFYEGSAVVGHAAADDSDDLRDRARREAERGLTAGLDARDWAPAERDTVTVAASVPGATADGGDVEDTRHAAAVALAVYGDGTSPF